jgi:hypothetical protein
MKRPLLSVLIILLSFGSVLAGYNKKPEATAVPESLKIPAPLRIIAYSADSLAPSDTVEFTKGDSVFIFDGELYYRAQANGREFFVSRRELLSRSDSLIIYQNYRLINKATMGQDVDTVSQKVVRQRCNAINADGTRCKRLALPGKTKCWQHINQ